MNVLKICWYIFCGYLWMFYSQYNHIVDALGLLWMLDTFTWIIKYFRLWRLTSKWLRYGTIVKTIMLWIPLVVAKIASAFWLSATILSVVFAILCFAESISILQNLKVIRTGKDESEQDVITKLLEWILNIWNIILEKTLLKLQKAWEDAMLDVIVKDKK